MNSFIHRLDLKVKAHLTLHPYASCLN